MKPMVPILPWVEGREDRLFKRLAIVLIVLFILAGVVMNRIQLPDMQKKELAEVAPRLAKLIMEKKVTPPPPPPPLQKVIKKEPPVVKKDAAKKAEVKKPLSEADKRAAAKKTAQKSGLIALKDELADLRDSFDFSDITDKPQQKAGKQAETVTSTQDLLASATQGSGGIQADTLNRQLSGSELASRKTTSVKSTIPTQQLASTSSSRISASSIRSQEEIERVFQKNKGAIFNIYNRELRKDPSLQGKIVVELTIQPDGSVSDCVIISSELKHARLENRLIAKIKSFSFTSRSVPVLKVTYPIDFLPS
ncbi:MAG: AgmX/PglI C-terminal domain-containing protein [Gammaproteobacteria bacterium]|nr:AgmX/PglI C-terminal domain-containing protein [Gammaproteobacteria bacterium]